MKLSFPGTKVLGYKSSSYQTSRLCVISDRHACLIFPVIRLKTYLLMKLWWHAHHQDLWYWAKNVRLKIGLQIQALRLQSMLAKIRDFAHGLLSDLTITAINQSYHPTSSSSNVSFNSQILCKLKDVKIRKMFINVHGCLPCEEMTNKCHICSPQQNVNKHWYNTIKLYNYS